MIALRCGSWYVGIGVGPVNEPLPNQIKDASGHGLIYARRAVDRLRNGKDRIPVAVEGPLADLAAESESVLRLLGHIVRDRSPRRMAGPGPADPRRPRTAEGGGGGTRASPPRPSARPWRGRSGTRSTPRGPPRPGCWASSSRCADGRHAAALLRRGARAAGCAARGRRRRRTRSAVTSFAAAMTSSGAWPMATPRPAQVSISMSLRPSPTATVRCASMSSRPRRCSSALALVTPAAAMSSQAVQPTE